VSPWLGSTQSGARPPTQIGGLPVNGRPLHVICQRVLPPVRGRETARGPYHYEVKELIAREQAVRLRKRPNLPDAGVSAIA
jgi:hypothetical protein